MKKAIIVLTVLSAVCSICVLVFLSLFHDPVSDAIIEANKAYKEGDTEKAFDIYFDLIQKDQSNEEPYVKLAEISELKKNYKDAAYFWSRAFSLNQLEKSHERKMYEAMIASKSDGLLISRYAAADIKNSIEDEILYNMGLAFIRESLLEVAKDMRKLIMKNSDYGALLESYISLSSGGVYSAFNLLQELQKRDSQDENFAAYVDFNMTICFFIMGEIENAKTHLDKVPEDMPTLLGDRLIMKGKILFAQGSSREALKCYLESALLQGENNLNIVLETAELAMVLADSDAISKLAAMFSEKSEKQKQLLHYMKALEYGSDSNWGNALKSLKMSGLLQRRIMAKILAFKCACGRENLDDAIAAANRISPREVSATVCMDIARNLSKFLQGKKFEEGRKVAETLLAFDAMNFEANKFLCLYFFNSRDFNGAWTHGTRAFEVKPEDDEVYSISSLVSLAIGNYETCVKMSIKRLELNSDDLNALLFMARSHSLKNDIESAADAYESILEKAGGETVVFREAGLFFTANKFEKSSDFISKLEKSGDPRQLAVAKSLLAEKALIENDKKSAEKYLIEGLEIAPNDMDMSVKLAELQFSQGKLQDAKNTMKKAAEFSKNPEIYFQYAILLSQTANADDASEAMKILGELPEKYAQTVGYNLLFSSLKAGAGDLNSAIEYARLAVNIAPDSPHALKILLNLLLKASLERDALLEISKSQAIGGNVEIQKMFFSLAEKYLTSENLAKEGIPFLQDLLKTGSLIGKDDALWTEISNKLKSELNQRKEKRLNERVNVESI